MFWVFKRTRFTNSAVNFFNSFNISNNNSGNTGPANGLIHGAKTGTKGKGYTANKKVAYNKLALSEEILQSGPKDQDFDGLGVDGNGNHLGSPGSQLSETSSTSDFDLEEEEDEEDFSDASDYDESLTCNVCDRSFCRPRQLEQHQQKKRHFGCSTCDTLFQSLMALEHHKAEFEHWSGDEMVSLHCPNRSEDETSEDELGEEMERLL